MGNLSKKEMLEVLADFQKHELTTKQRTEMLKAFSAVDTKKPKRQFNFQRIAALAAVFILILIAPILYLTNTAEDNTPKSATIVKHAQETDFFCFKG